MISKAFLLRRILGHALLATLLPAAACATSPTGPGPAKSGPAKPGAAKPGGHGALYGAMLAGDYAAMTGHEHDAARYDAEAISLAPGDHRLLRQGFIMAVLAGSPEALRLARKLPHDALAAMIRGNHDAKHDARQKAYQAAAADYALIPRQGITGLIRPLLIAWAQYGAGDTGGAIGRLQPLATLPPFGGVYALNAALIADLAGRTPVAASFYRDAAAAFPVPNLRVGEALASWQARQGHRRLAARILASMTASHPELRLALPAFKQNVAKPILRDARDGLAEVYLSLAGSLTRRDQRLLQQSLLRFALQFRPGLAAARLLLAGLEADQGKPEQAIATLRAIKPDQPLYAPAAMREAALLGGLGKRDQAIALLKTVTALAPDAVAPLQMQADLLRDAKHYAAAKQLYTQALAKFGITTPPGAWSLYYGRAIAEDQSGDWKAALADLRQARKLAPDQPYLLNYLGYSYAVRGVHLRRAQALIERALQAVPDDGAVIDSLGYILLKRGRIDEAMRVQISAVRLTPDEPEANAHLGDIFMAAGDRLAALHQWQRALALKPDAKLRAHLEAAIKADHVPPVKF
jgi:tetratricopeptide (TPR) repeat protein